MTQSDTQIISDHQVGTKETKTQASTYSHPDPSLETNSVNSSINQHEQPRHFKTAFCTCCGTSTAFLTFCQSCWCPCITYSQTRTRINGPQGEVEGCAACLEGCVYCILSSLFCHSCIGASERQAVRKFRRIGGTGWRGWYFDCIVHCFCAPVALTQEKLEIDF